MFASILSAGARARRPCYGKEFRNYGLFRCVRVFSKLDRRERRGRATPFG